MDDQQQVAQLNVRTTHSMPFMYDQQQVAQLNVRTTHSTSWHAVDIVQGGCVPRVQGMSWFPPYRLAIACIAYSLLCPLRLKCSCITVVHTTPVFTGHCSFPAHITLF
uniref:Uncharacterized protein n=1 Tax=Dunaliella tertiolecta TaxID=3047 RepID=A0A7S3VGV5_DUNTE